MHYYCEKLFSVTPFFYVKTLSKQKTPKLNPPADRSQESGIPATKPNEKSLEMVEPKPKHRKTDSDSDNELPEDLALLFDAISEENEEQIRELINKGVDINASNNEGVSALHVAVEKHSHLVGVLLSLGADVNVNDNLERTPLHYAAIEDANDIIELLLEQDNCNVDEKDSTGSTPLHLAVMHDCRLDTIKLLIENGADVRESNSLGDTVMHLAIKSKREEVVRYFCIELLASNPQLAFETNCLNQSVVDLLFEHGQEDLIKFVTDNFKNENHFFPLHLAIEHQNERVVRWFLNENMDIHEIDQDGHTPLLVAVETANVDIIKILLLNGVRMQNNSGYDLTHLHMAIKGQNEQVLRTLLGIQPEWELNILKEFGYRIYDRRVVIDCLVKNWLRFKIANICLDESLLHLPYFRDLEDFCRERTKTSNLEKKSKKEVALMIKYNVLETLTLYDVLKKPLWKVTHYFQNEEQRKIALTVLDCDEFPVYQSILEPKILRVIARARVYERCVDAFSKIMLQNDRSFPMELCGILMDFLTDKDLQALEKSFFR